MKDCAKAMLRELQRKYGDKKFKLPNGVELSVNQYITEYVSNFFDINAEGIELNGRNGYIYQGKYTNDNCYVMIEFLEEFILSECQQKYNGDIMDLVIEKFDDDFIKDMIEKIVKSQNKEIQRQLLSKNISDDIKYYCFKHFDKKVCEDYLSLNHDFAKRMVSNDNGIIILLEKEVIVPSTIIDDEFFDNLISNFDYSEAIVDFRNYINALSRICDVSYLEKKLDIFYGNYINLYKDYENTIKNLNLNSNKIPLPQNLLFVEDFVKGINYLNSLLEEYEKYKGTPFAKFSKRNLDRYKESTLQLLEDKLDNILIDNLFKENITNVRINLNEIVSYNNYLSDDEKLVDDNTLNFYKMIINIKKLGSDQKLDLYNKFKGKNIPILYYDDLRKCKNDSYKRLKNSLMNLDNYKPNKKLSDKYGSVVYDMRDEEYIMLTRCLSGLWVEECAQKVYNESFRVISNNSTGVWMDNYIIYGYSNVDIDKINHVFYNDAGSSNLGAKFLDGSYSGVVDNILLPNHLAGEVNISSDVKDNRVISLKPSYIICKDEIDAQSVKNAKKLGLPIVLIKNKELGKPDIPKYDSDIDYTYETSFYIKR